MPIHARTRLLAAGLIAAACAAAPAAFASSTAASSVSDSASMAVGSLSNSIGKSSQSSTGGDKELALGDHRVLAMDTVPGRPEAVRLVLAPAQGEAGERDRFHLDLPRATAERHALGTGQIVTVQAHAYGYAFVQARGPFFLVLRDAWFDELGTRPVTL
ncbi:MAG: hypothetical protein RL456_1570 [Pseudomonadota bacterium]